MSRRDTIIVAALINAGLLIILFVSALKGGDAGATNLPVAKEKNNISFTDHVSKMESKVVIGDEVDQVLSQYTRQNPLEAQSTAVITETPHKSEAVASFVEPIPSTSNNFVDDLNALTKASEHLTSTDSSTVAVSSAQVPSPFKEIQVKKGDVLEKIAKVHSTTVQELMKINKLSSTSLHIGQVLKVPNIVVAAKPAASSVPASAQPDNGDSSVKYYVVKSGDNPWTIAVKNHIKVEDLLRLNNMDEAKARKLKPGDQIRIR